MGILAVLAAGLPAGAAYLTGGWTLALRDRPGAWARARKLWTAEESIRASVRGQFACMIFFWPLILPGRALRCRADGIIDKGDPQALARQAAERERRIAELEAENERLRAL